MPTAQEPLSQQHLRRWRQLRIPAVPYFELTPRCTLDCKMCYVHLTPAQMGDRRELTTREWLELSDQAFQAGMIFMVLTGGECMLHPGFWEIYEHLRDLGVSVSVNTNAYALTEDDLARFRALPPSGIRVTLYGASEEGYERCTGRRAFGRVMENIGKLRDLACPMSIALTLCRQNAGEFLEMARLAKRFRAPVKYVLDLDEPNRDTGRRMEDFALDPQEMYQMELAIRRAEGLPIFDNPPLTLPGPRPDGVPRKGTVCAAGNSSYVIHWDGRMTPCFNLHQGLNVLEVGFQAAWEAVKAQTAAMLQPVECETCPLQTVCRPCVLSRRDPTNPGHCNPARCRDTLERYRLGIVPKEAGGR